MWNNKLEKLYTDRLERELCNIKWKEFDKLETNKNSKLGDRKCSFISSRYILKILQEKY